VESSDLQESKRLYNNAQPEYHRYYYDSNTGGFILIHLYYNTNSSEIFLAEILAKQGKRVKLLSEQGDEGVKTPDANINGKIWEFKELSPDAISIKNTIQRGVAVAKKRAPNLVYYINNENANIKDINRGIARTIIGDIEQLLQTIILVFNDGNIQALPREKIDNGKYFQ
jgi:hypothetical protein